MSERDPRVDPRRGDELEGEKTTRWVMHRRGDEIGFTYFRKPGFGSGNDCYTSLARWRKWAATAEVIQRGEDAATGRDNGGL